MEIILLSVKCIILVSILIYLFLMLLSKFKKNITLTNIKIIKLLEAVIPTFILLLNIVVLILSYSLSKDLTYTIYLIVLWAATSISGSIDYLIFKKALE